MRALRVVLRPLLHRQRRWLCSLPSSSEDVDVRNFLPSEAFLKQFVRRPSHRDKLTSLISELQIFLEMFGKDSLPEFTDSIWSTYFGTWSAEDRCQFLNQLRLERKNARKFSTTGEKEQASVSCKYLISVINQRREDNGEMVYAPGFNALIELRGQEFRRTIDRLYGSRLLALQRCEEELPKLVIDCRFLTDFSVAIQSTFAKHLLFQYGPPSIDKPFSRHPFAPTLTAKGVEHASGSSPSDIMYISWRATQFLPDEPPPNVRAVVLCTSRDYQPWSSSVSAAQKDGITAYRLPLERYARFEFLSKHLPLNAASSILRSYFRGDDIGESIKTVVDSLYKSVRSATKEETELFEFLSKHLPLNAASSILRSYFRGDDIGESIKTVVDSLYKSVRSSYEGGNRVVRTVQVCHPRSSGESGTRKFVSIKGEANPFPAGTEKAESSPVY
ncbi:hypothetical protein COOONC_04003 [Cooperia oncophora]